MINRAIVIVLDSVGIGKLPDAAEYGDAGCNTLAHTAQAVGGCSVPNLAGMGLGNIAPISGVAPAASPTPVLARWRSSPRARTRPTATGR